MAYNYFNTYVWLVENLRNRRLTLKELQEAWLRSVINEDGKEFPPKTLRNHVKAIGSVFGIEIRCDRRTNEYYISNPEDLSGNGIREWMLDALSLNSALAESRNLKERISFEKVPSGQQHLLTIIGAMRAGKVIIVSYRSFKSPAPRDFVLEPYALRQYKRRWYLYALKRGDSAPHIFALDRMQKVAEGDERFNMPADYDFLTRFSDNYGVYVYDGSTAERVLIRVPERQANYFRSLPLHHSQREVESADGYSIFSLWVCADDYDLQQDILSFGTAVEVLEPLRLRKKLGETISQINKMYNN